jgi:hypothetical protein
VKLFCRSDLTTCRECLMCGGCEAHDGCLADFNHITWFTRFASPGEDACGAQGARDGRNYACALPAGHVWWHQARSGDGWPS